MTVGGLLKLIRIDYSLFSALGVVLAGLLAGDLEGFQSEYVFAFLIVLFTAVGAFALNDYYDFEADKRNCRLDRPLVNGTASMGIALVTGLTFFTLAILMALFLELRAMVLVLLSLPIFFLYNVCLKRVILVKNIVIAYAFVATILLGSLVSDPIVEPLIVYLSVMGFIVGLAYEIMLDIGDVEGDRQVGVQTIAGRFGLRTAARLATILYVVIIVMDPVPFFAAIDSRLYHDYLFLPLILATVISYLVASRWLIQNQSKKTIFALKVQLFMTMTAGSVVYLVGVLR